jgi:hypothetical protein
VEVKLVEVTAAQVRIAVGRNRPGILGNGLKICAPVEAECCWVEPFDERFPVVQDYSFRQDNRRHLA